MLHQATYWIDKQEQGTKAAFFDTSGSLSLNGYEHDKTRYPKLVAAIKVSDKHFWRLPVTLTRMNELAV